MPLETITSGPFVIQTNLNDVLKELGGLGKDVSAAMAYIATEAGNEAEKRTSPITETWTNREGQFRVEADSRESPLEARALVYVSDLVTMLDGGTREHPIPARNAPALAFIWDGPGSYVSKTVPGMLGSRPGGPRGNWTFRKSVWHPGTEPRGWLQKLADDARAWFPEVVTKWVKWALAQVEATP